MDGVLRAFDSWMNGVSAVSYFSGLAVFALLSPIVALVHELGHALVGLRTTEGLVDVRVGRAPPQWQGRFGRLRLSLNLLPGRHEPAGLAKVYALRSRLKKAAFFFAGPFAHAAAGAAVLAWGIMAHVATISMVGVLVALTGFLNLVPFTHHGFRSDGARLVELLKVGQTNSLRALAGSSVAPWLEALQQTQARWSALVTDEKALRANDGLTSALAWAPAAVGLAREDGGPHAIALTRLALAGWCWREAERGDVTPILPELDQAWQVALEAYPGEVFPTPVAAKAAVDQVELGLASPGRTETERRGFLAGGFKRLPPSLRPTDLPEEDQWYAFRFGVAIHDVETAKPEALAQRQSSREERPVAPKND